ncbi:DedA family protein [Methylomonas methanica]|uniref:Alkaline phosphatase n=1 Tax=Methylomonas methanica TaxID=421 RepID=A0A177MF20_METMH|nr:DedA family protein [Methylomonas methanica]OAI04367.1 alkaline phosphatase [Methylomonas methanica]
MGGIVALIENHIEYAPWIIFGLLLLAGFNIPISEDGMLFVAATFASRNPEHMPHLFAAVYAGAYGSDLICYGLGRVLGPRLRHWRFFSKLMDNNKIDKVSDYYRNYGILTLLFGRFVPFGIRNLLFLTAGLGRMNAVKFAAADFLACSVSVMVYLSVYYHYGQKIVIIIQEVNIAIFILALLIGAYLYFKKARASKA